MSTFEQRYVSNLSSSPEVHSTSRYIRSPASLKRQSMLSAVGFTSARTSSRSLAFPNCCRSVMIHRLTSLERCIPWWAFSYTCRSFMWIRGPKIPPSVTLLNSDTENAPARRPPPGGPAHEEEPHGHHRV